MATLGQPAQARLISNLQSCLGITRKALPLMRQVLQAHCYWRWCGLVADLVVLEWRRRRPAQLARSVGSNARPNSLISLAGFPAQRSRPHGGGQPVVRPARWILSDSDGTLIEQLSCPETAGVGKSIGPDFPRCAPFRSIDGPEPILNPGSLTTAWVVSLRTEGVCHLSAVASVRRP